MRLYQSLGILMVVAGIAIIMHSTLSLVREVEVSSWPVTTGIVDSVAIEGERAFHVKLSYRYTIEGQEYSTTRHLEAPGFGGKQKRWNVAETTSHLYSPGKEIDVHYNPDDPSESLIHVGITYGNCLQIAFGVVLLIIGIVVIGRSFRRKRARIPNH